MPGRGRVDGLKVAGVMMAVAGMILGASLVERPGLVVPLTLESLLLAGVTWFAFLRGPRSKERTALLRLFWLALAVRALVFGLVHFGFNPHFFAPDAAGYELAGGRLSASWQSTGFGTAPGEVRGAMLYTYMNAVMHFVFGESAFALSILNLFAGVWTVLLAYRLGQELFRHEVGAIAGGLTALFPSMVLWSVLNIRDSLTVFLVILLVFAAVRSVHRLDPARLILFVVGVVALSGFRDYMGFLTGTGLVLGYLVVLRPGRIARTLGIGTVTVVALAVVSVQFDVLSRVDTQSPLSTFQQLRQGLQQDATSAYGLGAETLTLGETLQYLPIGLAFLLFAPFPWNLESALQAAAAPETLLWYPLFALAAYGLYRAPRDGALENWIPISVLTVVVVCYALVEGNFGTAYRHRAQIMPLFFVYSAVGIRRLKAHLLENPRSSLGRRTGTVSRRPRADF